MNSKFHKKQAEELIKHVNSMKYDHHDETRLIALAQVHATLANVADEEEFAREASNLD